MWDKTGFGAASHMLLYPDTGECITNDYRRWGEEVVALQIETGQELARVRSGNLVQVHALRLGAAEAVEIVVQGGRAVGKQLGDSNLPRGITVGAVVRGEDVHIAHRDTVIARDDHLIVFVMDKRLMKAVSELFQA